MEIRYGHCSLWLPLTLLMAMLLGCGGTAHELETAPVSGRITLDGEPLPQGIVYILPSKGRAAKGMIQKDGTFVMTTYDQGDGVQVGTHTATVSALPLDELDSAERKQRVPVPARYGRPSTSGLTVEVKPGEDNYVEWALSSSKDAPSDE